MNKERLTQIIKENMKEILAVAIEDDEATAYNTLVNIYLVDGELAISRHQKGSSDGGLNDGIQFDISCQSPDCRPDMIKEEINEKIESLFALSEDICDRCGSTNIVKAGRIVQSGATYQRKKCMNCGKRMRSEMLQIH